MSTRGLESALAVEPIVTPQPITIPAQHSRASKQSKNKVLIPYEHRNPRAPRQHTQFTTIKSKMGAWRIS
jgi:hypothetical protein